MRLTAKSLAEYKKNWEEETAREEIFSERSRQKALKTAEICKDILVKKFSVTKVVLFGSVLERGSFQIDSDIDIAVEGLARDAYFTALARIMMKSQFDVDLKPIEDVSNLLRERISRGKVLYEKKQDTKSNLRNQG